MEGEARLDRSSLQSLRRGFLVVISGPSAAGKNTLLNAVLPGLPDACYSVSVTTRPPRPGEVHGQDYLFVTDEEFDAMVERDELLEWAWFVGNRYGTPKSFVEEALKAGRIVLMDIDIQGAAQVRAKMPEAVFVFVLPPSLMALRERLVARGKDSPDAIDLRLSEAGRELTHIVDYDYVVFNENLDEAVAELRAIIAAERCRVERYDARRLLERFSLCQEGGEHGSAVSRHHSAEGR